MATRLDSQIPTDDPEAYEALAKGMYIIEGEVLGSETMATIEHLQAKEPDNSKPSRVAVLAGGYFTGDHPNRDVAHELADIGINSMTVAHTRGKSKHGGGVADYAYEILLATQTAREIYGEEAEIVVWGHSLGGRTLAEVMGMHDKNESNDNEHHFPKIDAYHFEATAAIGTQTLPFLMAQLTKHLLLDVPKDVADTMTDAELSINERALAMGRLGISLVDATFFLAKNPLRSVQEALECREDFGPDILQYAKSHPGTRIYIGFPGEDTVFTDRNIDSSSINGLPAEIGRMSIHDYHDDEHGIPNLVFQIYPGHHSTAALHPGLTARSIATTFDQMERSDNDIAEPIHKRSGVEKRSTLQRYPLGHLGYLAGRAVGALPFPPAASRWALKSFAALSSSDNL